MENLKTTLDKIQTGLAEVKRQYEAFFLGNRKSEPTAERRALEETIRKLGQRRIVNTIDQFRFNSLQGSFYTMSNLWARIVRDIEEGRIGREAAGALSRTAPAPQAIPPDASRMGKYSPPDSSDPFRP